MICNACLPTIHKRKRKVMEDWVPGVMDDFW